METKRVAIGELEGVALDWAVAREIGAYRGTHCFASNDAIGQEAWIFPDKVPCVAMTGDFSPSKEWSHAGPIVDRIGLVTHKDGDVWRARTQQGLWKIGPTFLVAACRAIVARHNPEGYVEVPVELLP